MCLSIPRGVSSRNGGAMPEFRRKIRIVDTANGWNLDYGFMGFGVTDTNWHTFAHVWRENEALGFEFSYFPYIFPIIDTSHYFVDTVCDRPTGFGVISLSSQLAMLSWDGGGASNWELAVGPEGCIPETATSTFWDQQVATLTGLEQGQWYYAWVRAVCDTARASQWSERLRFYVPADGSQEDITDLTATDRHTHIMPNPASTSVTVISAFRISVVEVWSHNGKLAMRHEADGMTTALDISTLPKGTYMLRIGTNHGYTHKKLVVE